MSSCMGGHKVLYLVRVDVDDLNIRVNPGTANPSIGHTGKGIFIIEKEMPVPGESVWGRLHRISDKKGWICLDHARKIGWGLTMEPFRVKISVPDLNLRKGAGTKYESRGHIPMGVFTIVDVKDVPGESRWGLLLSYAEKRNGWICLDHATRI
ncbi:MAG: hypothetical protein Q4B85_06785 [Lachnospiraceae bacterium]|nr:hypothetical protein [Lachnospiraceae bacterium]